jgi:hypothetical protein
LDAHVIKALCPTCQATLRIPVGSDRQSWRCPRCGHDLHEQPKQTVKPAAKKPTKTPATPRFLIPALALGIMAIVAVCFGITWAALHFLPSVSKNQEAASKGETEPPSGPPSAIQAETDSAAQAGVPATAPASPRKEAFPRRILAIAVNNYLFANPVHYGSAGHDVHSLVTLLGRVWQVPPGQVVELGDRVPKSRSPSKPAIEATIARFLDTSRPQDRILILFIGHAAALDERPYLVPIEGDLGAKDSLIPLSWLYDRLAACRARQKALVLDVCRLDPNRGEERPGCGPLPAAWKNALSKPPPGVEVWCACSEGQFSYEIDSGPAAGSIFLNQMMEVLRPGEGPADPRPEEPLPLAALAKAVGQKTAGEVKRSFQAVQTPILAGQEAAGGAPFDPSEPSPKPFGLPTLPRVPGTVSIEDTQKILKEMEMPFLKWPRDGSGPVRLDALPPISMKDLETYRTNAASGQLGEAVAKAQEAVRQEIQGKRLRDRFPALPNERQFQNQILTEEKRVAKFLLKLSEILEELQKAGSMAKDAAPRWRANYDFVRAQLLSQLAFLYEFQSLLGQLRKAKPPRDPKLHQGWCLVSQEKMQGDAAGKKLAGGARKALDQLIQNYPGTPWAILARRARLTRLGLDWQACHLAK